MQQKSTSNQIDKPNKRVLLITASVGSGHNQAALALAEELQATSPGLEITYLDVMDYLPRLFRAWYAGGYSLMMTHFPWLYGIGFAIADRPCGRNRTIGERSKIEAEHRSMKRFVAHVRSLAPDLVVHTHFLSPPAFSRMIRRSELNAKQFVVITDVQAHRWWYAEEVERWFVPQAQSLSRLHKWGFDESRVTVSGMPIGRKWEQQIQDTPELRKSLNLPLDKRIVLLSGGVDFTCGPVVNTARNIANIAEDICVVTLGGRNKKLLGKLSGLSQTRARKIVPMGYTDKVAELMTTASLVVTKPGGMITAECLAKAKPMVFLKPVPGQEAGNAEFFIEQGAAVISKNATDAARQAKKLLADPQKMQQMAKTAGELYRPGRQTIANAICQSLFSSPS